MALDPQVQRVLDHLEQTGNPELPTLSVAQAREYSRNRPLPPGPALPVSDRRIPGPGGELPIRVYRPEASELLGGLVYFHGGGFVLGDLDSHDALCRQLALDAQCVVVSVDYRLAPEHKHPAAVQDCYAATSWVHENADELGIDHHRLAVGGDSAGGNLATTIARLAKERRNPALLLQLLIYPVTDLRSFDTPSYLENATGKLLTREGMQWFAQHYVRSDADRHDPGVSPLAAKNLIGLPPALVITAEHDPLRDEGEAYVALLRAAHNQVTHTRYDGMIHAFVSLYAFVDQGRVALRQCSDALRAAFDVR
ncbi:MAG TPA: alpha/beta hydrolase [Polyangiales bacterium]